MASDLFRDNHSDHGSSRLALFRLNAGVERQICLKFVPPRFQESGVDLNCFRPVIDTVEFGFASFLEQALG